jgi:hypothetical protein
METNTQNPQGNNAVYIKNINECTHALNERKNGYSTMKTIINEMKGRRLRPEIKSLLCNFCILLLILVIGAIIGVGVAIQLGQPMTAQCCGRPYVECCNVTERGNL